MALYDRNDVNYAILLLLIDSACRIGEVLSLQVEDWRPKERQFTIRETKVNGMFEPGSVEMQVGGSYTFSQVLVGRKPGRWHIHPRLDLKGKGPIIGPGRWVTIPQGGRPYAEPVVLASGKTIDLERYGLSAVVGWHALWAVLALWTQHDVLYQDAELLSRHSQRMLWPYAAAVIPGI